METTIKKCTQCLNCLGYINFGKQSSSKDGLKNKCKKCRNLNNRNYKRTKIGVLHKIFNDQKKNSISKNNPLPSYSINEFIKWSLDNKDFHAIFKYWSNNEYRKMIIPSVDRINDYDNYNFNNIKFTTWEENKNKGHRDIKNGINNKASREIKVSFLDGRLFKTFVSCSSASRELNIKRSSIYYSCSKNKIYNGYKWSFKEP